MRAVVSVPPPGSNPTTMVIGLDGNALCAAAAAAKATPNNPPMIFFIAYFPVNTGFRFSMKAFLPST